MSVKIEILDYKYGDGVNIADATGATAATGWSAISINQAQWAGVSGGSSFTYFENLSQNLVVGKTYNLSFRITNYVGTGSIGFSVSSGVPIGARFSSDTSGIQTFTFVATATTTHLVLKNGAVGNNKFTEWDDASAKEVGFATGWTDADAQPTIPQLGFQSYNQLAWFDGTADYVSAPDNDALDVGDGDFSISLWVSTNTTAISRLVDKNGYSGYSVYLNSDGTIKIANKLITAVKLTDRATSPLANLVKTLEVTPPGAAAIIITPIAISSGIGIAKISPKAIMGSKIACDKNPTIKSLGVFITVVKSFVVNPRPRPNIITAKHIGAIIFAVSIGIS